jgi:hypothetical protein
MTKRLTRVAPLQLGVVFAAFYALLSLIVVPFVLIALVVAPSIPNAQHQAVALSVGMGVFMVVLLPIVYGVMGFLFGLLAAVIYNLVAKMTGGVEITTVEVPSMVAAAFQ